MAHGWGGSTELVDAPIARKERMRR
jgi:hypothetical protein